MRASLRAPPRIPPFSMSPARRQMGRTQRPSRVRANACSPHIDRDTPKFPSSHSSVFHNSATSDALFVAFLRIGRTHIAEARARRQRTRRTRRAPPVSADTLDRRWTRARRRRVRCARTFECCDDIEGSSRCHRSSIHKCAARTVDTSAPLTPLPNSGRSNMGSRTRPRSSRSRRRTRPRPSSCRPQRSRLASSRLRVTFVEPTTVSRCRDSLHPSLCARRRRHAVRGASAMDRGDDDVRRVHEFSDARRESTRCRRAARYASRVVCSRRSHANARLARAGENKRRALG